MIKIANTNVSGLEAAVRGMRNPLESWAKSDSYYVRDEDCLWVGDADLALMKKLAHAGPDHGKFLRMITVTCDITAPLYWWKEFDAYKVGTTANSCSTMHRIHAQEFTLDNFSHEHLDIRCREVLQDTIRVLNAYRELYVDYNAQDFEIPGCPSKKDIWWQMIQLLPSSYNQRRTVQLNYAVLRNMHQARKAHKLDEWRDFCRWAESLPYAELLCGEEDRPLTLEDFRELEGEPIWTVDLSRSRGRWEICTSRLYDPEAYGRTWLAYRRRTDAERTQKGV